MLSLPSSSRIGRDLSVQIYLCTASVDMRKGFGSLVALAREHLGHDPLGGRVFLFVGRSRARLKVLCWHADGEHPEYAR